MAFEKAMLGIVPGLQATALLEANVKQAQKAFSPKQSSKQSMKGMFRTGIGNIAGVGLIGPTAKMINGL